MAKREARQDCEANILKTRILIYFSSTLVSGRFGYLGEIKFWSTDEGLTLQGCESIHLPSIEPRSVKLKLY